MEYIDLHTHTRYSDGTDELEVKRLYEKCKAEGNLRIPKEITENWIELVR